MSFFSTGDRVNYNVAFSAQLNDRIAIGYFNGNNFRFDPTRTRTPATGTMVVSSSFAQFLVENRARTGITIQNPSFRQVWLV